MRNVTVSLPDDVYRRARTIAAERDISLGDLIRDLLIGIDGEKSDFDRRKRLQDEVLASIDLFRAADCLTRDQTHDRDAVR